MKTFFKIKTRVEYLGDVAARNTIRVMDKERRDEPIPLLGEANEFFDHVNTLAFISFPYIMRLDENLELQYYMANDTSPDADPDFNVYHRLDTSQDEWRMARHRFYIAKQLGESPYAVKE